MSAKVKDYRIGKFQLPRQAHVVQLEVGLNDGEVLGMVRFGSDPLKLWGPALDRDALEKLVSPVCPMSNTPIDDAGIKRLVREAAEHGNVLHAQIHVQKNDTEHLFHAFATVGEFEPSMIKFAVLREIEVDSP